MPTAPARDAAAADSPAADDEGVLVGHIQGAWGVRGEVKVIAQSSDASALLHTKRWRLVPVPRRAVPKADQPPRGAASEASVGARERGPTSPPGSVRDVKARRHAAGIVARIDGIADRDAAQALTGAQVRIARAEFPRTADDEYYWVDLIGCRVVNRQGEALGQVAGLIDTGVHSVLRVEARDDVEGVESGERLIPFVSAYLDDVDLAARTIRVDWGRDY